MTPFGYAAVGITAFLALLIAVMVFAFLRFAAAAKDSKRHRRDDTDTLLLSSALQDAFAKLKQQEQAMSARAAASEQLSAQIVENLTAGLLLVDAGGRIEMLNPAGRRMLQVSSEPAGADYRSALAATPPLVDAISECLTTTRPIVRRTLDVDGEAKRWRLGITLSPVKTAGRAPGVICLFSDLTTVRELEEQLRLKETLARLGELTAGIAHEFRNGLATIHGYSRLIELDELPPTYRPYLEAIREETDLLGKVVTDFLSFARPEHVSFSVVDPGTIARHTVDDLRTGLGSAAMTVTGEFGEIDGDEVLLRQVFENLIRNAVEACDASGVPPTVAIVGTVDPVAAICRIHVDDNGPGIPEVSRDRIFQPFFTTRLRGTGLGLAIVQKIVVMHNGRISMRDAPTGGASFQLVFPLARDRQ